MYAATRPGGGVGDVAAVAASVPLRYGHSPVELAQLDDIDNAARLIAAFALRLGADRRSCAGGTC